MRVLPRPAPHQRRRLLGALAVTVAAASLVVMGPPAAATPVASPMKGAIVLPDPPPPPPPPFGGLAVTCTPDPSMPVPTMVAAIFRCRLLAAGLGHDHIATVAAEAVTVAACESAFDPAAVVFGGRYAHRPHPNGNRYTAAGVFQFIRRTADLWIPGGYANVHDPVANIDAAARLWLHNTARGIPGWSDWACAFANDGFAHASVLPRHPGGPPTLPDWTWTV